MAVILPFRGIRYNPEQAGELAQLVAPPYDVVDQRERDRLVAKNPRNIFTLELPKNHDIETPGEDHYAAAGLKFLEWLKDGTLCRERTPAVYPYDIHFTFQGRPMQRRGCIALVQIEDWKDRTIRPHEQTFNKVTEDRLKLLSATEAQFSQVFALYRHNAAASTILESASKKELHAVKDDLGNTHRVWMINDEDSLRALHEAFRGTVLYIADGHHRYTTALRYRDLMRRLCGDSPSRPFNYLMMYLVDADDPGLVVMPTHRVVTLPEAADLENLRRTAHTMFDVFPVPEGTPPAPSVMTAETLARFPARRGLGVIFGGGRRAEVWFINEQTEREFLQGNRPEALSQLDVVLLEECILRKLFRLDPHLMRAGRDISYTADADTAVAALVSDQVLIMLRPTPVRQVLDVADAGLTMPHKTTFFYPKILTGLVLNSVDRREHLDVTPRT